jgi:hypothetical protein
VRPLTCSTVTGEPYTRWTDVEAEIAAMLALPPEEWGVHAPKHGGIKDETRVYLLKLLRVIDRNLFGPMLFTLMERAAKIVEDTAQGFSKTDLEIICDEVKDEIDRRITSSEVTRQTEILEISFKSIVERETLRAVRRRKGQSKFHAPLRTIINDDGDAIDAASLVSDDRPDPLAELIEAGEKHPKRREILAAVKDRRHRVAFILHELRGWPYLPGPEGQPCLCDFFNVSDRQIRTWIGTARKQMQDALGDRS